MGSAADLGLDEGGSGGTGAAPQEVAATVASAARGYSIEGVELRGYEVAKWEEATEKQPGRWKQLERFTGDKKGYTKAVESARWWFNNHWDEEKKECSEVIRIRPIISVDPSSLKQETDGG